MREVWVITACLALLNATVSHYKDGHVAPDVEKEFYRLQGDLYSLCRVKVELFLKTLIFLIYNFIFIIDQVWCFYYSFCISLVGKKQFCCVWSSIFLFSFLLVFWGGGVVWRKGCLFVSCSSRGPI